MTNKKEIKNSFKQRLLNILPVPAMIGIVVGAIGGWIYYIEIGCNSGTCPLTSNPYLSILWGALIGYLLGDMFRRKKPVETGEENQPS